MPDLADLTIAGAGAGLRSGDFTSEDLLDAVTKRASATEAHLHAYLTLDHDGARAAAKAADDSFAAGEDGGRSRASRSLSKTTCARSVSRQRLHRRSSQDGNLPMTQPSSPG